MYIKFAFVLSCYMCYVYFRRFPLMSMSQIRAEVDISKENIGFLVSGQAFAFTFSKLCFGVASDSISPVYLLVGGLLINALMILLLGFATSFYQILVIMFVIGAVQGGGWVPSTRLVNKWFAGSSFGTMFSILGCGSSMAGLLLPTINWFYWRSFSTVVGLVGITVVILTFLFLREDIESASTATKKNTSWKSIATSSVLWGIAFAYLCTLEMRTVSESWMTLYVSELGLQTTSFSYLYEVGGITGTIVSGATLDLLSKYFNFVVARRNLAFFFSTLMLTVASLATSFPDHTSYVAFCLGCSINSSLNIWCMILAQAGTPHNSGSCQAFVSFLANFGSVFAGAPLGALISHFGYSVFIGFFGAQLMILGVIYVSNIPLAIEDQKKDL